MQLAKPSSVEIASLRAFNRVYTQKLGLLNARLDGSAFSLAEARVLYELAHRTSPTAAEISRALSLDRAQLSRMLKQFGRRRLVTSTVSPMHAKHRLLSLTKAGRAAFDELNRATQSAVGKLLAEVPPTQRGRLLAATTTIAASLGQDQPLAPSVALRNPKPGDLGWIICRQARLYADEFGWDWTYEALVAEILAGFVRNFVPDRECAWIAERDGAIVGSIFLMQSPDPGTAKLRLLYVEAEARGLGIGRKLVDACVERAREVGYRRLELWTNSVLVSARRIYEAVGFELREETPHHSFGQDLVGQVWSLDLGA